MKQKVLVVDDASVGASSLVDLLRLNGWEAECVGGAEEALERLKHWRADALVLDQQFEAGMDGLELLALLRGREATRRLSVLFLTAVPDAEVKALEKAAAKLGHAAVLRKGIDPPEEIPLALRELFLGLRGQPESEG